MQLCEVFSICKYTGPHWTTLDHTEYFITLTASFGLGPMASLPSVTPTFIQWLVNVAIVRFPHSLIPSPFSPGKVLSRLGLHLTDDLLEGLVNSKPGCVEQALASIRDKVRPAPLLPGHDTTVAFNYY